MPLPSPFHPRTADLCTSLAWKTWAGYFAVEHYGTCHEREYYAIRHAAAMIDVTPLYKIDLRGPDAARLLARVTVRDITKLDVGRCTYLCWCDDDGMLLDDGTVTRLSDEHFRLTAAEPYFHWFESHATGMNVELRDTSAELASLAVQGPRSRKVVAAALAPEFHSELRGLPFFGAMLARIRDFECVVTRTGYTGDLGYELWCANESALELWDAVDMAGYAHGLLPAGLSALDVARVEAGFILAGVDYSSARDAAIPSQKNTPFETGLGWTVELERDAFIGQRALIERKGDESARATVGLVLDWNELEHLYEAEGLPPELPSTAWRGGVPVYGKTGHVGRATSGVWSPTLKQNLAIGQVDKASAKLGTKLEMEVVVEYQRKRVTATVSKRPFFNPPRKRSTPKNGSLA